MVDYGSERVKSQKTTFVITEIT